IDEMTPDSPPPRSREPARIALVEAYAKAQGLFRLPGAPEPVYSEVIELDLTCIEPSLAGPKRPQDRVSLKQAKGGFQTALGLMQSALKKSTEVATAAVAAATAMTSEGG